MNSLIGRITKTGLRRILLICGVAGACTTFASQPTIAVDSGNIDLKVTLFPGQKSLDDGVTWRIYRRDPKCSVLYDPGPGKHAVHKEILSRSQLQIELEAGSYCVEARFNSETIQPGGAPIVLRTTEPIEVTKDKNIQKVIALNPAGLRITYTPFKFPDALPARQNPSALKIVLKPDEFPEKASSMQQRLVDAEEQQPLDSVKFDMTVSKTVEMQRTYFVNNGKHKLTAHANYGGHLSQAPVAESEDLNLPPAEVAELQLSAPVGLLKPTALAKKPAGTVSSLDDVSNLLVPIEYRIYRGTGSKPADFKLEFDKTGMPNLLIKAKISRKKGSELYRHDIRYLGGQQHVSLEKRPIPVLALAPGSYLVEARRTDTPWSGQEVNTVVKDLISEPEVEVRMGAIVLGGGKLGPCARFARIRTAVFQPSNSLHGRRHLGTAASGTIIELMAGIDYELEYTMHSIFGARKLTQVSINEVDKTAKPKTGAIAANTQTPVKAKFPNIACAQLNLVGVFGRQIKKKARWDFFKVEKQSVIASAKNKNGNLEPKKAEGIFNYSPGQQIGSVTAVHPRIAHELSGSEKEQDILAVVTVGRHKYSGYFKMKANSLTQAEIGTWQTKFLPMDELMSLDN